MHTIERKIHLIEEVLKIDNENVLDALEDTLEKSKNIRNKKLSIYDFVGVISSEEAAQMTKAINETAETINADDWK